MKKIVLLLLMSLSLTSCVAAAVGAAAGGGYYVGKDERKIGTMVDDASITSAIKSKYIADKKVSALNINIDTYEGVVTLYGSVSDYATEQRAIELAYRTAGVRQVISKITVVNR